MVFRWSALTDEELEIIHQTDTNHGGLDNFMSVHSNLIKRKRFVKVLRPSFNKTKSTILLPTDNGAKTIPIRPKTFNLPFEICRCQGLKTNWTNLILGQDDDLEVYAQYYHAGVLSPVMNCLREGYPHGIPSIAPCSKSVDTFLRTFVTRLSNGNPIRLQHCAKEMSTLSKEFKILSKRPPSTYRLIYQLAFTISKNELSPSVLGLCLSALEASLKKELTTFSCPGFTILSPPGTGKTFMFYLMGLGLIDSDSLNRTLLYKDPTIIRRLNYLGFSVLTNCWEWKEFSERCVYIGQRDIRNTLASKNIYSKDSTVKLQLEEIIVEFRSKFPAFARVNKHDPKYFAKSEYENRKILRAADEKGLFNLKGKIPQFNLEDWIDAYKDVEQHIPCYFINKGTFLQDELACFLRDALN